MEETKLSLIVGDGIVHMGTLLELVRDFKIKY